MTHNVVVVTTPASPLLPYLLHTLSHESNLNITVLTRQTSISIPTSTHSHSHGQNGTSNGHHHPSKVTHIQTDFSESELQTNLQGKDTVICSLIGSDLHLSAPLIDAASDAGIKLFIPSEYGLDTSNTKIRELLPPYRTRFEIQEKLRASGMNWKAIYSGLVLEDAMKTDGVMGVDALWASVVVFPGAEKTKVAVSAYTDIARGVVEVISRKEETAGNEIYRCGFRCTLEEVIAVVEKELEKEIDRYEGDLKGAKKEALERMKMGFFDGGVALMGRVAVWDQSVDAWGAWKNQLGRDVSTWESELRKVVRQVRNGEIGGEGCGC